MSMHHVVIDEARTVLSVHPEAELSAAQESARSHRAKTCCPTRVEQTRFKPEIGSTL